MGNTFSSKEVVIGYASPQSSSSSSSSSANNNSGSAAVNSSSSSEVVVQPSASFSSTSQIVLVRTANILKATNRALVSLNPDLGKHLSAHNVRHLDLSFNNIVGFSSGAINSSSLLALHLSHNRLAKLPSCICELPSLVLLDISFNRLTALPASIGKLGNLKTLRVTNNQLAELPKEIATMQELSTLDVADNCLRSLPSAINRLRQLRIIIIDGNPLLTRDDVAVMMPHTVNRRRSRNNELADSNTFTAATTQRGLSGSEVDVSLPETLPAVEQPRVRSLVDIAARAIVRHNIPVSGRVPPQLLHLLSGAKACTACGGPYFGEPVMRYRFIRRAGLSIPLEHNLCSVHWNTDTDRVKFLFQPKPATAPSPMVMAAVDPVVELQQRTPTTPVKRTASTSSQQTAASASSSSTSSTPCHSNTTSTTSLAAPAAAPSLVSSPRLAASPRLPSAASPSASRRGSLSPSKTSASWPTAPDTIPGLSSSAKDLSQTVSAPIFLSA